MYVYSYEIAFEVPTQSSLYALTNQTKATQSCNITPPSNLALLVEILCRAFCQL